MNALVELLASIIRPIIVSEFDKFRVAILEQIKRNDIYEKYDLEAQQLIEQIAKANTSEERWAYVAKLKDRRAKLNI